MNEHETKWQEMQINRINNRKVETKETTKEEKSFIYDLASQLLNEALEEQG